MSTLKVHLTKPYLELVSASGEWIQKTMCNRDGRSRLLMSRMIRKTTCLVCQSQTEQEYYESTGYMKNNPAKFKWP